MSNLDRFPTDEEVVAYTSVNEYYDPQGLTTYTSAQAFIDMVDDVFGIELEMREDGDKVYTREVGENPDEANGRRHYGWGEWTLSLVRI